jgi:lipopolysaccharide assembly protein A
LKLSLETVKAMDLSLSLTPPGEPSATTAIGNRRLVVPTALGYTRASPVDRAGAIMRWVHGAVVVVFAGAMLVFVVQNFPPVTMAFLGFSVRLPMALMAMVIYVLGMATGGSLWALLRRSFEAARQ